MQLFHGSDVEVKEPKILTTVGRAMDFGYGFYTTSSKEQAGGFTAIVNRRNKSKDRIVSVYDFDIEKANTLKTLVFDSANEAWLDFVIANRKKAYFKEQYDLIIGPVANDDVFGTLQIYEGGFITKQETIARLLTKRLHDQYVFTNPQALSLLKYKQTVLL
ncbi:MAG: DUF3990 domain-containing protein [Firmicutes bacterium]|nr:DUF3990 domain-containing protein [Bacillota bacterium]